MADPLADFLGCGYTTSPLKPPAFYRKNALKPWLVRRPRWPEPHLVRCDDGRRFKLLRARGGTPVEAKLRGIEASAARIDGFPHVPRIVWSDAQNLLVEFITGEQPQAEDPLFARRLGEVLARLHQCDAGTLARSALIEETREPVAVLTRAAALPAADLAALLEDATAALPEAVPSGTVYRDQKRDNYILDETGKLFLIDLGSFLPNRPLDAPLVASPFFEQIDREAFAAGYRSAGGSDALEALARPLTILTLLRDAAAHRLLADSSWPGSRRRASREQRYAAALGRLRGFRESAGTR